MLIPWRKILCEIIQWCYFIHELTWKTYHLIIPFLYSLMMQPSNELQLFGKKKKVSLCWFVLFSLMLIQSVCWHKILIVLWLLPSQNTYLSIIHHDYVSLCFSFNYLWIWVFFCFHKILNLVSWIVTQDVDLIWLSRLKTLYLVNLVKIMTIECPTMVVYQWKSS